MLSLFDTPLSGDPQAQQVRDNYNNDILHRFRGTLARVRRKAMLSKDPQQLGAYLQLAATLGVDPGFSATGRASDRAARAQNKLQTDQQIASMFQSPMAWLMPPQQPTAWTAPRQPRFDVQETPLTRSF